jgi:crotonobetainyl-CoA:carnitine CoA-transferase CaiB-like acyl-CoA transferase
MTPKILTGIRVLDFTRILAGPFATRILADFGAEVIKVQDAKIAVGTEANAGGYFQTWNRNKKSVTLDLDKPAARVLALKLAKVSDLVIENFSSRVMGNWGLGYRDLQKVNPSLIMLSMSAAGHTGPGKDWVALAPTLQALSGLTYLSSFSKENPLGVGFPYGDIVASLFGVIAVLGALEYRKRTGVGQWLDLSEYEALCTLLAPFWMEGSAKRAVIDPPGNQDANQMAAPHGCYRCQGADRWCVIAVHQEGEWKALCRAINHLEWLEKDEFSNLAKRIENRAYLDGLIEEWTRQRTPEEVVDIIQGTGVPAGIVQNAEDLVEDPHLCSRKFFLPMAHPILGEFLADSSPIRFAEDLENRWEPAPALGEHNSQIFMELLGLTEEQLSSYIRQGVIA